MKLSRGFWVLTLAAGACGDDDVGDVAATETTGVVVTTTTGPAPTSGNDETTGEDDGLTGTTAAPDVGGTTGGTFEPETTGDDATTGNPIIDADPFVDCRAVDYLYVIDNSESMLPQQEKLMAALVPFSAVTNALLPASAQSHMMVVKTDERWGGHCIDHCDQLGLCLDNLGFDCSLITAGCDATLGAGVLHPYGIGGRNEPCELDGEARYITPEERDVLPALTCLTDLGVRLYETPRTAEALVEALSSEQLGPDGCNEGFLRDDALLVITILTDKSDTTSAGDPMAWYEAVVEAKGRAEDVFVISLFAGDLQQCDAGAESPGRLADFVDLFPNAIRLDSCAPSYHDALVGTVIPVGEACEAMAP
jgi:hypothetical protein